MVSNLRLLNISGTNWGTGSYSVGVAVIVGQSGTTFIPLRCTDDGILIVGSTI